jgi:hypothetical protein
MKSLPQYSRIIGLNLHPRHFGYVVLEARDTLELLDWGVCRMGRGLRNVKKALVSQRLYPLLRMWHPSFLVADDLSKGKNRRTQCVLEMVKSEARGNRISVHVLDRERVARAFGNRNSLTKYQRASFVAQRFPVLRWKLPPQRKSYESEDYRMNLFDAAAVALVYACKGNIVATDATPDPGRRPSAGVCNG